MLEILDPIIRILFRAVIGAENYQCIIGKAMLLERGDHTADCVVCLDNEVTESVCLRFANELRYRNDRSVR